MYVPQDVFNIINEYARTVEIKNLPTENEYNIKVTFECSRCDKLFEQRKQMITDTKCKNCFKVKYYNPKSLGKIGTTLQFFIDHPIHWDIDLLFDVTDIYKHKGNLRNAVKALKRHGYLKRKHGEYFLFNAKGDINKRRYIVRR